MTMTRLVDHLHTLVLPLALAGVSLAPALAHADSLDCYEPTVEITEPVNGATFEGVAEITVTVSVEAGGSDAELTRVYVLVDDVEAATLPATMGGTYELAVMLAEGQHVLVAGASDDCAGEGLSESIAVQVTAPAGASTGEAGSDDGMATTGDDTGDDGGDDGGSVDDGGCAISRTPTRSWVGLSAFVLVVLGAWRLRRAGV